MAEEIFDEVVENKVWPGTRAVARNHLDQGQRVWLVTAAPVEVATIIAKRLGLTGALGTVAEHVDGVYTGRLVGDLLHGPAKAEAVRALATREGLELEQLLGLQRLGERHSRCCPWSAIPVPSTRTRPSAHTRRNTAGGSATTGPGGATPRSAWRPVPAPSAVPSAVSHWPAAVAADLPVRHE